MQNQIKLPYTISFFFLKGSNQVEYIQIANVNGISKEFKRELYGYLGNDSDVIISNEDHSKKSKLTKPLDQNFIDGNYFFIEKNVSIFGEEFPEKKDNKKEWMYSLGSEGSERRVDMVIIFMDNEDISDYFSEDQIEKIKQLLLESE